MSRTRTIRLVSIVVAAMVAFALAAGYTARAGAPLAHIHDEFGYLLAGEMFSMGRVAMPSPSSPAHFQTIHELVTPSYASKYPPAQGMAIAAGLLLANDPRVGVWLSFAILAGALTWMLQAWMPPRWSIVPALCSILLLSATSWTYTFWGGAMAALGGALMYGALGRLAKRGALPRRRDAVLLAIGVLVLANSRPLEGLLVALPAAWWTARWMWRGPGTARLRWGRVGLPAAVVLSVGAAGMLQYNAKITGSPWRLPQMEYERQAGGAPPFVWGSVAPLSSQARETDRDRWEEDVGRFEDVRTLRGYVDAMSKRARSTLGTYVPLFAAFPLLLLPWAVRSRGVRTATASLWLIAIGVSALSWYEVHYAAPALGALLIVYVRTVRMLRVRLVRQWGTIGRVAIASLGFALLAEGASRYITPPNNHTRWAVPTHWTRQRAAMAGMLADSGGRHVIFVRYAPTYNSSNEWVYNGADLNGDTVVWANDLGDERNRDLLVSSQRQGWLVVLDGRSAPQLTSYELGE